MTSILGIEHTANRKWYHIIGWWEARRIPYNIVILAAGFISLQIAYVSIPLIYTFIVAMLNVLYCFGWITDIIISGTNKMAGINRNNSKIFFLVYLVLSILFVFSVAISILVA